MTVKQSLSKSDPRSIHPGMNKQSCNIDEEVTASRIMACHGLKMQFSSQKLTPQSTISLAEHAPRTPDSGFPIVDKS